MRSLRYTICKDKYICSFSCLVLVYLQGPQKYLNRLKSKYSTVLFCIYDAQNLSSQDWFISANTSSGISSYLRSYHSLELRYSSIKFSGSIRFSGNFLCLHIPHFCCSPINIVALYTTKLCNDAKGDKNFLLSKTEKIQKFYRGTSIEALHRQPRNAV